MRPVESFDVGVPSMFGDLMPRSNAGHVGSVSGGTSTPVITVPRPGTTPTPTPTPTPAPTTGTTHPANALSGWQQFYNSQAYQVPLAEGLKAVNTKYAALGALESGAAMKAIDTFAAGHAAGALNTYLDDLYRQEALGASSASALAGVGQGLVSQVTANNNNASSAAGNAALYGGQAAANGWNSAGSAIGTAAGSIAGALGSSYHPNNAFNAATNPIYGDAFY